MDSATIGILGREYAAALLAQAKAKARKQEAVAAYERACAVELRALKALGDAVQSNVERESLG